MFDSNLKILPALIYSKDHHLSLFNYPKDVQVRTFRNKSESFFYNLINEQLMEASQIKHEKEEVEKPVEKRFISSAYFEPKFQVENYSESIMIIPGQNRNIYRTSVSIKRKYNFTQECFIELNDEKSDGSNITWKSSKIVELSRS